MNLLSLNETAQHGAFRRDIQAIRGLAVLIVVLFHAQAGLDGGFVGVDVFFVVSGYVISALLLREFAAGTFTFGRFYARRARRLLPALAVVSALTLLASVVLLSPTGAQQTAADTAAASALFAANGYLYRFGVPYFRPADQNPFLHMWSLGVEEQFYLALPALLAVLWWVGVRLRRPRRTVAIGVGFVCLASLVVSVVTSRGGGPFPLPTRFAFYLPVTRVWEFGVGVLVAVGAHRVPNRSRVGYALGAVGVVGILAAVVMFDSSTAYPGFAAALPVVGTCLMLTGGAMSDRWIARASQRWLVWLGDRSYEWYLWHWPLIVFVAYSWPDHRPALWIAAAASLGLADVTRRVVGERYRRDSAIVGRRAVALAAVCVIVPLSLSFGVKAGAGNGWGVESLRAVADAQERTRLEEMGCDSFVRTSGCFFDNEASRSVVLVGDSQAASISDMARSVVEEQNADFGLWTRPGCPLLIGEFGSETCDDWSNSVVGWLETVKADVVVVNLASLQYSDPEGPLVEDGSAPPLVRFLRGVSGVVERLSNAGATVVLIAPIPEFEDSQMNFATLLRSHPTPSVQSIQDAKAERESLLDGLQKISESGEVILVDPFGSICGERECSQYRNGWIYRDGTHLSAFGVALMRQQFEYAIRDALS